MHVICNWGRQHILLSYEQQSYNIRQRENNSTDIKYILSISISDVRFPSPLVVLKNITLQYTFTLVECMKEIWTLKKKKVSNTLKIMSKYFHIGGRT